MKIRTMPKKDAAADGGWWNLLSPDAFPCSACLTQVEWVVDADGTNDDNVLCQGDPSPGYHPSENCVGDSNVLNISLIDEDSNQTSDHTAENHVHDITLDITAEPYDENLRRSPSPINNHAIITPPRDYCDYPSTIGEFGSCSSESSFITGECPICLHTMANADILYPLQCPGKNCKYNFCLKCMSSLVKASQDSYEMASDGSLRVKVHLNCPNCRASIKGIIEDAIHHRQVILAEQMEEDDESYDSRQIIGASSSIQEEMESEEFLINKATIPRLKNRARAPTYIRRKRKDDLMKELNSIPAPSLVRDQVLATYDRTLRDPSQHVFSSTISRPFYSSAMVTPLDTKLNGGPRRHSKSFDADRRSPSSVMDEAFWTGEEQHGSSINAKNGRIHRAQEETNRFDNVPTRGAEDDFLAKMDLYWCCSSNVNASNILDISGNVREKSPGEKSPGCGGYVDYIGTYHQCTANVHSKNSLEPCQGCTFRRGIRDGGDDDVHEEELYYDSDCGQQYAVGTWASAAINHASDVSLSDVSAISHSSVPTNPTRENTKSLFGRMRVRQHLRSKSDSIPALTPQVRRLFRSNSDVTPKLDHNDIDHAVTKNRKPLLRTNSTPSFPTNTNRGKQHTDEVANSNAAQEAYIYDYFSQKESPIRTGMCSTLKAEIGNCVRDALNSRWRLDWHHVAVKCGPSLQRRHPTACEVWIERGYFRNRNEIVEPKLMWRELTQPGFKQGMLTESTLNPYRASLFALRRIVSVADGDDWQRMSFDGRIPSSVNAWKPMAKPNCLIAVRSSVGQDYLFEASCPEERDRIIHLWKMTTARLVSHAVAGNSELMMREFFNEAAIQGGLYSSMVATSDGKANGR
eukprot:scaffold28145_cov154-Skeletonema_menzelii.AAC.1